MAQLETKLDILRRTLKNVTDEPQRLDKYFHFFGADYGDTQAISVDDLIKHVSEGDPNDIVRLELHKALMFLDHTSDKAWAGGTQPNTRARRQLIYQKLGFAPEQSAVLDRVVPFYAAEHTTVIAQDHAPWYSASREESGPYWQAYRGYLETAGGWDQAALLALSESTKAVLERISDPCRSEAFQAKGLVVGYVQSGKTANFTGVVARAADAGYRLLIVLTGTTEILRRQTQRRLDKEMIGREFLEEDYEHDADLSKFLSHGTRPSQLGHFDWQRLTGPEYDYQSLRKGIGALEFEKKDRSKPIHDPVNLRSAKARLIVIKKNAAIMGKVIKDLQRIKRNARLEDVPALIIDDESDQASLNTTASSSDRTSINKHIVHLLKVLPRCQYVGYTATPFANVFVDPLNAEDLFPKDFILSLPRPPGYMGVSDFYNFDGQTDRATAHKHDYVRPVIGLDSIPENLPAAIDSFILSGALKLFRVATGVPVRGPHHTMLVHISTKKTEHRDNVQLVTSLLGKSEYRSGDALDRLKLLYERDFLPVSNARAGAISTPKRFRELESHIGECLARLSAGGRSVLMINSEKDADAPDFDRGPVWKILVGGTKLSRGFTVEGLCVSYYRRAARAADTLMQMGRWFGFRSGYEDLVRLYIGTQEPLSELVLVGWTGWQRI